ncbi:uncharacterized protein BCR38DRAFT_451248 [Pseudomassariella vexata]|uniref:Uncharacterized protein n=1 Tax=Pseudomassariella vexata TaxID=1141098 RepID=A0A1Y2DAU1_9PEZI|nr:uncharacterized protein BCR38DRAFT_451248 [Pseudomassariella vexata]ORY56393.1 hypothetical protein BCR38DRAFT_451248 [Pseudomassariella vexata]
MGVTDKLKNMLHSDRSDTATSSSTEPTADTLSLPGAFPPTPAEGFIFTTPSASTANPGRSEYITSNDASNVDTHGSHNSRVANASDPRIDSDQEHHANLSTSVGDHEYTSDLASGALGSIAGKGSHGVGKGLASDSLDGAAAGGSHGLHSSSATGGPSTTSSHNPLSTCEGEAGPHDSGLGNAADPRVDTDRDASRAIGNSTGPGVAGSHSSNHTFSGIHDTGTTGSGITGSNIENPLASDTRGSAVQGSQKSNVLSSNTHSPGVLGSHNPLSSSTKDTTGPVGLTVRSSQISNTFSSDSHSHNTTGSKLMGPQDSYTKLASSAILSTGIHNGVTGAGSKRSRHSSTGGGGIMDRTLNSYMSVGNGFHSSNVGNSSSLRDHSTKRYDTARNSQETGVGGGSWVGADSKSSERHHMRDLHESGITSGLARGHGGNGSGVAQNAIPPSEDNAFAPGISMLDAVLNAPGSTTRQQRGQ